MNNIKISVVIPVFNVEKYLDQMLQSVYNQSLNDIEVVIVNDGSNDNSEDIILKYINKYNNTVYIKQDNGGVSVARNSALPHLKGKYTIFLDPDDYIEHDMLEKLFIKAEETCAETVICGYRMFYDENYNLDQKITFNIKESKNYNSYDALNMILNNDIICFLWNKLFLTKNIINNSIKFDIGRYSQDWFPVFKLISKSNKIAFINEALYNYRIRNNSNSHNKSFKRIEDHTFAIQSIIEYIECNNINIDLDKYYQFIMTHEIMNIKMCSKQHIDEKKKIYQKCKISNKINFHVYFRKGIATQWKIKYILFNIGILHRFVKKN